MELSALMFLVAGPIYFIPLIMAKRRKHKNAEAIGFINIFLGWTVVGWVFALALASSGDERTMMKQCVSCRDFIMSFAPICPYCRTANTTVKL